MLPTVGLDALYCHNFSGLMDFEGCSGRKLSWKADVEARDDFRKGGRKAEAGAGGKRRGGKQVMVQHQSWVGHGTSSPPLGSGHCPKTARVQRRIWTLLSGGTLGVVLCSARSWTQ